MKATLHWELRSEGATFEGLLGVVESGAQGGNATFVACSKIPGAPEVGEYLGSQAGGPRV